MGSGFQRIKGIETGRYVAMNSGGIVYSTVSKGVQLITDYVIRHIRSRFFEIKLSEIIKRPKVPFRTRLSTNLPRGKG